jgi:hypothetical protein
MYGGIKMVRVTDSAGIYWLSGPPEMKTAKEAVAWTYGLDEQEYDPERA